jgi:hypothetical protein
VVLIFPLLLLRANFIHPTTSISSLKSGHCRSVVYDHLQHSCRLYGHDGRKVPAIIHPANGFDLFRRTASSQECAGVKIFLSSNFTLILFKKGPIQRILALHAKKGVFGAANHPAVQSTGGKGRPIYPPVLGEGGDADALGDQELTALLDKLDKGGKGHGMGHFSMVISVPVHSFGHISEMNQTILEGNMPFESPKYPLKSGLINFLKIQNIL